MSDYAIKVSWETISSLVIDALKEDLIEADKNLKSGTDIEYNFNLKKSLIVILDYYIGYEIEQWLEDNNIKRI